MLQSINRPLPSRTDIEIQMNGEYSLWRIMVPVEETDNFHNALDNIKSNDGSNRLQRIEPGESAHWFDVILTEAELLQLRLSVQGIVYGWMKDWIYAKL